MQTRFTTWATHLNQHLHTLADKSKGLVRVAPAVLACCVIFSSAAGASCDSRPGQAGVRVMPTWQAPENSVTKNGATMGEVRLASIVGLWHVLFVSDGKPFDEGFDMWLSDGTEILNDTAPPQPANGAGTVCLGVFRKTGPRTYKLKDPFWSFDPGANLVGTGLITETVTLDAGGDSYHGSFKFQVFDPSKDLVFEAAGHLTAERITPD
ncbi:MAG: hypothetical protein LAN64_00250 [Acidobacteriia bacterium]|nr:hypothetical protein [Terriglobia bacterium]